MTARKNNDRPRLRSAAGLARDARQSEQGSVIFSRLGEEVHRERKKDGLISSARNLQPEEFVLPLPPVVVIEAVAKLTGIIANDIVRAAIVAFGSAKDVDADMMFRQRISAPRRERSQM